MNGRLPEPTGPPPDQVMIGDAPNPPISIFDVPEGGLAPTSPLDDVAAAVEEPPKKP